MSDTPIKLPDTSKLVVSSSPHVHEDTSVSHVMITVVVSLLPAIVASVLFFGPRALAMIVFTALACVAFEMLANKIMKQPYSVGDWSAVVTGVLLAMNLPPTAPFWLCFVGAGIAIILGKMVYGGIGNNPFNPALVGRMALLLAFPTLLSTYISPFAGKFHWATAIDAQATATPLTLHWSDGVLSQLTAMGETGCQYSYLDLFLGNTPGCIGETSALAILIGGLFLIYLKLIRWHIPVTYIGTVALITGIAYLVCPDKFAPPLVHVLSGGLFLSAFYMASDMVTTPLGRTGAVVFGVGCGIITSVIRLWGTYPEGVTFSILIMNALTPLIDRATAGRPFGTVRNLAKEVKDK